MENLKELSDKAPTELTEEEKTWLKENKEKIEKLLKAVSEEGEGGEGE